LAANATRPGVRCDDLAVCPWRRSTRSPSEPAPAAASPLDKREVWCLALNRIGGVLWWGWSFGAAGKRASDSIVVSCFGSQTGTKQRLETRPPLHLRATGKRRQFGSWSSEVDKKNPKTLPAVVVHRPRHRLCCRCHFRYRAADTRTQKRGTARVFYPSLASSSVCQPANIHHNIILFGACQGHQVR
jgi:hypothetical protein